MFHLQKRLSYNPLSASTPGLGRYFPCRLPYSCRLNYRKIKYSRKRVVKFLFSYFTGLYALLNHIVFVLLKFTLLYIDEIFDKMLQKFPLLTFYFADNFFSLVFSVSPPAPGRASASILSVAHPGLTPRRASLTQGRIPPPSSTARNIISGDCA